MHCEFLQKEMIQCDSWTQFADQHQEAVQKMSTDGSRLDVQCTPRALRAHVDFQLKPRSPPRNYPQWKWLFVASNLV